MQQPLYHPVENAIETDHRTPLFVEDEDALLAGETDFFHLAIVAKQDGVVAGLGFAIFPAAFALCDNGLAPLHGGFVAID